MTQASCKQQKTILQKLTGIELSPMRFHLFYFEQQWTHQSPFAVSLCEQCSTHFYVRGRRNCYQKTEDQRGNTEADKQHVKDSQELISSRNKSC